MDMINKVVKADSKDHKTTRHEVHVLTYCAFSSPTLTLDQALARDGFRCVLTGMIDKTSLEMNKELVRTVQALHDPVISIVDVCHIVNESTMQGVDPSRDGKGDSVVNKVWAISFPIPFYNLHPIVQTDCATNAPGTPESFGPGRIIQALLVGNGVHNLGNLISLEPHCRGCFNNLELWFEATDEVCHSCHLGATS